MLERYPTNFGWWRNWGQVTIRPAALSRIPHPTMPRELLDELLELFYQTVDPTLPFSLATIHPWLRGP